MAVKIIVLAISILCFLTMPIENSSAAEQNKSGANITGTSLSLAYDGNYTYYKEVVNGEGLDRDTAWQSGAFLELRGDSEYLLVRVTASYTVSTVAKYTGALQDGTPLNMGTKETFYQGELNMGYKALNFGRATLSPYVGIGYLDWKRGENNLPDYQEDYSWWYAAIGLNFAAKYNRWYFSLDGAVLFPFDSEMTTNIAGQVDTATFNIKSRPGYRAEVMLSYDAYKNENMTLFVFTTPYYRRWNIGQSPPVMLTQGGTPIGFSAYEPKSSTDVFGLRIGIGVNF